MTANLRTGVFRRSAFLAFAGFCLAGNMAGGLALVPGAHAQASAAGGPDGNLAAAITSDIEAYCTNIADEARDRRYLLQAQDLEQLQGEIDARIAVLEDRRAEYEDWLKRRNDFLARAEAGLVDIYKGMRADAAAERLQLVDPAIAAAILMKLNPRMASQILNEMDRTAAARLTGVIASAADEATSRNPS